MEHASAQMIGCGQAWTRQTLQTLIDGVPNGKAHLSETIWHEGLARHYLLKEHNAIAFRIEITSHRQGLAEWRETARVLLQNLLSVPSWDAVTVLEHRLSRKIE